MKKQLLFILFLLTVLLLVACGGSAPPELEESLVDAPRAQPREDIVVETNLESEASLDSEPELAQASSGESDVVLVSNGAADQYQSGRMVIYTANIGLTVEDPQKAANSIATMAIHLGGFVVTTNLSDEEYGRDAYAEMLKQGTISIRVSSENYQTALQRLRAMAVFVDYENSEGNDVTDKFTDLRSRVRNLEVTEAQLMTIMESATKTEDVLRVHDQLNDIREEIELLKGQMKYLQEASRLSLINIRLTPYYVEPTLTPTPTPTMTPIPTPTATPPGWTPVEAISDSTDELATGMQNLTDGVIYFVIRVLPFLILFGAPVVLIWRWTRKWRARSEVKAHASVSASEGGERVEVGKT